MKRIITTTLLAVALFGIQAVRAQGFYVEFRLSTQGSNGAGSMKAYSQDGNRRSELVMSPGQNTPAGFPNIIAIVRKDAPDKIYMLNEEKKTYTETDASQKDESKDEPEQDYEVTIIGKETVNGYAATHVKVLNKSTDKEQELWTSIAIPGYEEFAKIKTKYTGIAGMNKALAAKGAQGFPVRVKVVEHTATVQLDLVKAEKRNNPSSLFSLDGYTKSTGTTGPEGKNMQDMMQKMQNMTPEERQKYIEQLKQQYGGSKQ